MPKTCLKNVNFPSLSPSPEFSGAAVLPSGALPLMWWTLVCCHLLQALPTPWERHWWQGTLRGQLLCHCGDGEIRGQTIDFFTMIWICFVSPENIPKLNNCGTVRVEPLCCLDVQPSGLDLGKVFRWDPHNWILVAVTENRVGWRCISMLKHSPSKCKALELIPKLGRNHEGKARGCTQFPYLLQVVPCIFLGLLSMRSHSTLEQKDKTKKNPFLFQHLPSLCHCATEHL